MTAAETWADLGLPVELLGEEDNWWSNGPTGPCGPDSEIFAWTGTGPPEGSPGTDERWLELWNHVTLRFERHPDGSLTPLAHRSVDTGMGLERLLMVANRARSVFGTDAFAPWLPALPTLWPQLADPEQARPLRIITDHLRSSVVVIGDGVRPATTGRGYVLRRLLRRALTELWRADPGSPLTLGDLPPAVVAETADQFRQPGESAEVRSVLLAEERRFRHLLTRGRSLLARLYPSGSLTESDLAYLHETHGLPRELVTDVLSQMSAE